MCQLYVIVKPLVAKRSEFLEFSSHFVNEVCFLKHAALKAFTTDSLWTSDEENVRYVKAIHCISFCNKLVSNINSGNYFLYTQLVKFRVW